MAITAVIVVALLAAPQRTNAHHEAIFGPQSGLVFSASDFLSFQTYVRRTGKAGSRGRETTAVVSAGITPFRRTPLSLTVVAPASRIGDLESRSHVAGIEDVIVGAKYKFDFPSLQDRFNKDGNFAMVMTAAELPSGSVDHKAFHGPMDYMVASLGSIERGSISGIGYVFGRFHGTFGNDKTGNNLFFGAGVAWTPLDDPSSERLISFQLGASHEKYFRDVTEGSPDGQTGGWGTLLHPTMAWGPGGNVLFFGMTSFPIAQSYREPAAEDRWRVGFGIIWALNGR